MKKYSEIKRLVEYWENRCDENIEWSRKDSFVSNKVFHENQARIARQNAEHYRQQL